MRVVVVQEHVDTGRGGAETSVVEMARHLAALGLDLTIVFRGPEPHPYVADNVTFWPLVVEGPGRAARTYRFVQAVQRLCRDEPFDIIHAVTPCLSANVYQPRGGTYAETVARNAALTPAALRGLKRLGQRFNVRQRFLMRMEHLLLRKHQRHVHVAALSEYVRRQVLAVGHVPPERVRLVFNGVDAPELADALRAARRAAVRAELHLAAEAPLVLFVAHNFKLKGLTELLRAAACPESRAAGWTIVVAGRDDAGPYERLARRLELAERVRFVGSGVPVRDWYAAADVLAHPTWYDPCSRVALEALSVGLPVVTTRYNGAAEVIEAGRHGEVIAEPGDAAALAAALGRALRPEVRGACRADAGRMAEQLSMARHARELRALYEEVLQAKPWRVPRP